MVIEELTTTPKEPGDQATTDEPVSTGGLTLSTKDEDEQTTPDGNESTEQSVIGNNTNNRWITAVIVVIVLIIVIVSAVVLVVAIVLLTRRQKQTKEACPVTMSAVGPHSSEGSESSSINTTAVTVMADENTHSQSFDLKLTDAYGTRDSDHSATVATAIGDVSSHADNKTSKPCNSQSVQVQNEFGMTTNEAYGDAKPNAENLESFDLNSNEVYGIQHSAPPRTSVDTAGDLGAVYYSVIAEHLHTDERTQNEFGVTRNEAYEFEVDSRINDNINGNDKQADYDYVMMND